MKFLLRSKRPIFLSRETEEADTTSRSMLEDSTPLELVDVLRCQELLVSTWRERFPNFPDAKLCGFVLMVDTVVLAAHFTRKEKSCPCHTVWVFVPWHFYKRSSQGPLKAKMVRFSGN